MIDLREEGQGPARKIILPTIAIGLDEIFVTEANLRRPSRFGDFMPILSVALVRRGSKQRSTVFSLS